jgi:AraC-like DNA-binding protein
MPADPLMHFEIAQPTGPLAPLITNFYLHRSAEPQIDGIQRADTGHVHFILHGGSSFRFPDGREERSHPVSLYGPGTAAAQYRLEDGFACFGFGLRPVGWGSLVGLPASYLADRITDGVAVFGVAAHDLLGVLRTKSSLSQMIAAVTPLLLGQARPVPPAHAALADAVRQWVVSGDSDVAALMAATDMSERHVTRLLNHYFGGPPKLIERKTRAIRAAILLTRGAKPAEVVEPFYDQSHMIREIRHFTGHTPRSLMRGVDPAMGVSFSHHFVEMAAPKAG